jgi:crossover junction endonuclease MUS81
MATPVRLGRKRPLPVCPNPLCALADRVAGRGSQQGAPHSLRVSEGEFRLGRLRTGAAPAERASRSSLSLPAYSQALRSLRRYPLPLRSGKEAKILQHFGDGLCRMLDERLQQHGASGGERLPPAGAHLGYFDFRLSTSILIAV